MKKDAVKNCPTIPGMWDDPIIPGKWDGGLGGGGDGNGGREVDMLVDPAWMRWQMALAERVVRSFRPSFDPSSGKKWKISFWNRKNNP